MKRGFPELGATPVEIFRFLADGMRRGTPGVLVTMIGRDGSSVRSLGSHMAVMEDGSYAGSFSGGCIEAAIVTEAQQALRDGAARTVRYGRGSPYLDIRLPCGGGVDLLFVPNPPAEQIARAAGLLADRSPVTLSLTVEGAIDVAAEWTTVAAEWRGDRFLVRHAPPLRLIVAGEGAEALALVRLAQAYGAQVALMSPDEQVLSAASPDLETIHLRSITAGPPIVADPWTALVLLFHSHEWETMLLRHGLETSAFWIGAMGSEQTHQARLETLTAQGVPEAQRARVRGPIGLIPATRDPATLALSALSEIVGVYQQRLK